VRRCAENVLFGSQNLQKRPFRPIPGLQASEDPAPDAEEPAGDDDGCEKVSGPGAPKTCASHNRSRGDEADQPCV
jgi:hypothetical protein